MATHHDIAGRAQSNLHHLSLAIAQGETDGLDGLAACLIPFLSAIDWRGDARQVAEASPHAAEEIDLVDFRNILSRLGLSVHSAEVTLDVACGRIAPCVFLPRSGEPIVVMNAAAVVMVSSGLATTAELEDACRELGILDMVQGLPEGFDTRFGDQTVNRLPPGFLYCFSVAAALLRRPAILLLDEAHDGLDGEMAAKFLVRIKRLRGKTTIVMSTHRPSHMRMADRILLLDQGRLVEDAPPAEAMERVQARLFGAGAVAPRR